MGRKYKIISADGHVETPPESWVKYMPEEHRERAPRLVKLAKGGEAWLIEGQPLIPNGQNITGRGPVMTEGGSYFNEDGSAAEGAGDAAQRLREQDIDGIDAEVLFPPVFASRAIEHIADKDVYRALIRAYNTFLAKDYCAVAPDRLIGNGVVPTTGVDDAIAEIEFLISAGIRSVSLHMFPNGSGLAQPEDDAFWKRSLEIGMKMSPHFGFGEFAPAMNNVGVGIGGDAFAGTITQRVSGQPPIDAATGELVKGDIRTQTKIVMENVKLCLETAGTTLDKVVKCNIYVTNIAYYDVVNEIYGRYFPTDPPARTFAAVASWPWEFDIEIECVALA